MDEQGSLTVRLFTSSAMIPLPGASVSITQEQPSGARVLLAARRTNFDGLTDPIAIGAPPAENSRNFSPEASRYTQVNVSALRDGFQPSTVAGVQIFSGVETVLPLELVPLPALPASYLRGESVQIPPQTLSEV